MHLPIDKDALARVVSAKLATGNENEYRFQEDCGSSDTTTFVRLVKKSDIRRTVLVGVSANIAADDFEKQLLERRFDQNLAFLKEAHRSHALCPVILAIGRPHEDFAYSWIAYDHVEGWQLASNWHQLKPEIRKTVVENIANFVRELALTRAKPPSNPSVDYVGSMKGNHILFPPILAANSAYWLNSRELEGITSYPKLVSLLAEKRATMLDLRDKGAGAKSLVAKQIRAVIPVVVAVLAKPYEHMLAHTNLLPQNIWIDPFSGKVTAVFGWEYAHYAPVWMATAPLGWLMDEKQDWMLESEKMRDPWGVWRPHFDHPPENTAKEMRQLQRVWDNALTAGDGIHRWTPGGVPGDKLRRVVLKVCFVEENQMSKVVSWAWRMARSSAPPLYQLDWVTILALIAAAFATLYGYQCLAGSSTSHPDVKMRHPVACVVGMIALIMSSILVIRSRKHIPRDNGEEFGDRVHFQEWEAVNLLKGLLGPLLCTKIPWAFGYRKGKAGAKELAAVPCSPANSIAPTGIHIPGFMSRAITMMSRAPTAMGEEK